MPALVFFVILFSLISASLIPVMGMTAKFDVSGIMALFAMSNIALWYFDGDYFQLETVFNFFTHTWSLGVEEQFYFIFPFLAFFMFPAMALQGRAVQVSVLVLVVAILASFGLAAVLSVSAPAFAFYMLPTRLWELGIGVLLYVMLHRTGRQLRPLGGWLAAAALPLALILLVIAAFATDPAVFPVPWALPAVAFATVVLTAVTCAPKGALARLLSVPPLVWIGRLSYSLYLAHFGIVVLFHWTIGLDTAAKQISTVVLSVLLAMFSFHVIENPVRRNAGLRQWPDGRVVVSALGLVALSGLTALLMLSPGRASVRPWRGASLAGCCGGRGRGRGRRRRPRAGPGRRPSRRAFSGHVAEAGEIRRIGLFDAA